MGPSNLPVGHNTELEVFIMKMYKIRISYAHAHMRWLIKGPRPRPSKVSNHMTVHVYTFSSDLLLSLGRTVVCRGRVRVVF